MYPIPDDVASLRTEEIVRYGRCEMRSAVIDRIAQNNESLHKILAAPEIHERVSRWFKDHNIFAPTKETSVVALVVAINDIVENQQVKNRVKFDKLFKTSKNSHELKSKLIELKKALNKELGNRLGGAQEFRQYLDVAVVYEFDFEITEQNTLKGDAGFKLPLLTKTVDADVSAALLLTRKGKRTFKTQDKWGKLVASEKLCAGYSSKGKNVLYPLGGSIGVDRVVTTFADLVDQGGSKDSFVDALIFTTDASGGVNASIKINPVPDAFRLVSASAHSFNSRVDAHKLTLSLVFPKQESSESVYGVDRFDGDLDTPFERPADWRARYNLCVADARGREDALKALRLTAPEIYCIQYADAFDPQYGQVGTKEVGATLRSESNENSKSVKRPSQTPASKRPNFIPY